MGLTSWADFCASFLLSLSLSGPGQPGAVLAGADFADLQLFPGAQPQPFQTICGKFKISHPAKQSRGLGQSVHPAL